MPKVLLLPLLVLLSGCTICKTPTVVGGNQTTGTVRLGYNLAPLQKGKVNNYLANGTATRQCRQWGFATAQPYGNPISTCSLVSGTQCLKESVILEYQCRGIAISTSPETSTVNHWY